MERPAPETTGRTAQTGRGFTIVELLVVIGVIAILLGVTIPVLIGARAAASEAQSLANLRSIGQTMGSYAAAFDDHAPFGYGGTVKQPTGRDVGASWGAIWLADANWPVLVAPVAGWEENYRVWISPGVDLRDGIADGIDPDDPNWTSWSFFHSVSYRYSNSFVADPKLWAGEGAGVVPDESLIRAVRRAEVRSPSSKVMFHDADRAYLTEPGPDDPRPLGFADGSAALHLDTDAAEPVPNPLRDDNRPDRLRYHDTPDGVRGRDFN